MKEKIANFGAILSAFVASLCCIGPLVLAALGLGGAGFVTGLEEYRPYLIFITVIFLGAAFYFTYRKREVACEDGSCKMQRGSKWHKIAVWFIAAAAILLLAFPYLEWDGFTASTKVIEKQNLAEMEISVQGMTCVSCNTAVEMAVSQLEGVVDVKADYQTGKVMVKYHPSEVDSHEVAGAINHLGYKVQDTAIIEK